MSVAIFDTTLRDGEQAPGATMNIEEKILIAKALENMGVDVIESGFPAASYGDFAAVERIAKTIKNSVICGLCRAKESDIQTTQNAIKYAPKHRIHTFIATSPIHMQYKLKMQPQDVLQTIASSVNFAKNISQQVEWSAEDATRSESDFLFKAIETAIKNGATIINLPDTVGYTTPEQYYNLIKSVLNSVPNIDKAIISVHCHDDLGLAAANSLSGVLAGARQIECTINGIGERAGNTALEEVVMALKTRFDQYNLHTNIDTTQISRISKLVSNITGFAVPPNKAIVGSNAFAHESGIHQDGMLKNRATYEIISPESVGVEKTSLKLGKLSGRAAFKDRLSFLGYDISAELLEQSFIKFKDLADKKKEISDADIISLVDNSITHSDSRYQLLDLLVNCGNNKNAQVFLQIKVDTNIKQVNFISKDGPVDAIFSAINQLISHDAILELYQVQAVTAGTDAQASVLVRLCQNGKIFSANGASTDVLVASALAYLNCLEKLKN